MQLRWLDNYTSFDLCKTQRLLWGGSRVSCSNAVSHVLAECLDKDGLRPRRADTLQSRGGAEGWPEGGGASWRVEEPPGRKHKAIPILPASSPPPRSPAHAVMSRLLPHTGQGLWAQPFQVKQCSHRENFASEMNVGLSIQWVYKQFAPLSSPCLHSTGSGPQTRQCFGTLSLPAGSWTACISWRNFSVISELILFWPGVRHTARKTFMGQECHKKLKAKNNFFPPPSFHLLPSNPIFTRGMESKGEAREGCQKEQWL